MRLIDAEEFEARLRMQPNELSRQTVIDMVHASPTKTGNEKLEVIKKTLAEAKKHRIHNFVIACSIEEYQEIKAICKSNFPKIKVIPSGAIERGKVYLWDDTNIYYDFLYCVGEEG